MELFLDWDPYSATVRALYTRRYVSLNRTWHFNFGSLGSLRCLVIGHVPVNWESNNDVTESGRYPCTVSYINLQICRFCKSWNFKTRDLANSGDDDSLYEALFIARIVCFWRITSFRVYFMYVFPHIEIPYRRYGWTRLKYNILRCSQVTIFFTVHGVYATRYFLSTVFYMVVPLKFDINYYICFVNYRT